MADQHRGFNPGDQPRRKSSNPLADIFSQPSGNELRSIADYQRKVMAFITAYNTICEQFGMQLYMDPVEDGRAYIQDTISALAGNPEVAKLASGNPGTLDSPYFVSDFDVSTIRDLLNGTVEGNG
jgi:hypothetical protein